MTQVLAVDDEPSILRLVELVLGREGFVVQACSSPLAALAWLEDTVPDVIVCDMRMPELSGLEFLTRVRQDPRLARVPFLFLSSYAERADVRTGMVFGADDYLGKPFNPKELVEAIRVRLERFGTLKAEEGAPAPPPLEVRALGGHQVIWQGTPVVWSSRKAAELFFYLLEKGHASSWEVAEALWPDKDEERASSLFHTTLHRLRKSMFPEVVESSNRRYALQYALELSYDAREYREQARTALSERKLEALDTLIARYGAFLPEFDSLWCEEVRDALCRSQVSLLEASAELHHAQGTLREAQIRLEQAVNLDPLSDPGWRALERVLTQLGDPRAQNARQRQPWWTSP